MLSNTHMKKYMLIILLATGLFDSSAHAQNITLGVEMNEQQAALTTADPVFDDGRYYRNLTYSLKAGQSAMFYMLATEFSPQIFIVDTLLADWKTGTQKNIGLIPGSFIWVNATEDYTFHVVYSSVSAPSTGTFYYGVRVMPPGQNDYAKATSTCDRLNYILNNWLTCFGLIPNSQASYTSAFSVTNTFAGASGMVYTTSNYKEIMVEGEGATSAKYDAIVAEIKSCLDLTQWDITTDYYMDELLTGASYTTTYFTLKGSIAGTPLNSFSITWIEDVLTGNELSLELY